MKAKYILGILPLIAVFACGQKNNIEVVNNTSNETLAPATIKVAVADTKTVLNYDGTDYTMTWSGSETLVVTEVKEYTLSGSATANTNLVRYNFNRVSVSGGVATFTCDNFPAGSFQDPSKKYAVAYKHITTNSAYWNKGYVSLNFDFPNTQYFNSANAIGLAEGVIPMYGVIKGDDENYNADDVHMNSCASVLSLVLTNSSATAQTIGSITLSTDKFGAEATKEGIAGWYMVNFDKDTADPDPRGTTSNADFMYKYKAWQEITLDCGNFELAGNGTQTFSFVVPGDIDYGNITFKVWDNNDPATQVGADIVVNLNETANTNGKLTPCVVYRKTATI